VELLDVSTIKNAVKKLNEYIFDIFQIYASCYTWVLVQEILQVGMEQNGK
jgi:hypothetical protein